MLNVKMQLLALSLQTILVGMSHAWAASPGTQDGVAASISVLTSERPSHDKAIACRRLVAIGDKAAAEALASLLADEKLATYARSALEAIPAPAAGDALRKAAKRLEGNLLIGVLDSIGKRRDTKAIDTLTKLLNHENRDVATTAARALGKIGSLKTAKILTAELTETDADRRLAAATACLICAQRLQQNDHHDPAVALYSAVRMSDVPGHLVLAATQSEIVVRGSDGLVLIDELLQSDDESRFRVALQAARDLGPESSDLLIASFPKQPALHQVLLVVALNDIDGKKAVPLFIEAAETGKKSVRVQAIQALGKIGDSSVASMLFRAAVDPDADIANAASEALAVLETTEIDATISDMLADRNLKSVQLAVILAGRRSIASATPALFVLSKHHDTILRLAAIKSLGLTIQLADLPKLIALAVSSKQVDQQSQAKNALKAACARLPREDCSKLLTVAMIGSSTQAKVGLLEQIFAVGGKKALETVVATARSEDNAMQDVATRLLGKWMTTDAAPELFRLAKRVDNGKYQVRSLRGYIRIARQLNMSPEERLEICQNAMEIAVRDEEKNLVLETLVRIGTPGALNVSVSYLGNADLREPACSTVVAIAEKLLATSPAKAQKALVQVVAITTDPRLADRAKAVLAQTQ